MLLFQELYGIEMGSPFLIQSVLYMKQIIDDFAKTTSL